MMSPRFYLIVLLSLTACGMAAVAALNYAVDPYGFYRPHDHGPFPNKPAMTQFEAMSKHHVIKQIKPDTVIIGSSRADYGLNIDYNAALKGITARYLPDVTAHAIHNGANRIILPLDFFMFNDMMISGHDMNIHGRWQTLISMTTFKNAVKTILFQNNPHQPSVTETGNHTTPHLATKITQHGVDTVFTRSLQSTLTDMYFPAPARQFHVEHSLNDFQATLLIMRDNNIDVTIIINPVHADLLVMMHHAGLWDMYEEWKHDITKMARDARYPITDFTGIHEITTNKNLFWDASHYKTEIGDMMLNNTMPHDLPMHQITHDLVQYECANPQIVDHIRSLITDSGFENRLIPRHSCVSY